VHQILGDGHVVKWVGYVSDVWAAPLSKDGSLVMSKSRMGEPTKTEKLGIAIAIPSPNGSIYLMTEPSERSFTNRELTKGEVLRNGTLIDKNSPLYELLPALSKGDLVVFSGKFVPGSVHPEEDKAYDALRKLNYSPMLTEQYPDAWPDSTYLNQFLFTFTSIEKYVDEKPAEKK